MAKGITPRDQDYSRWYQDVVAQAQLADQAPVKGCMVIRPHGYAIWENMQRALISPGTSWHGNALADQLKTWRRHQHRPKKSTESPSTIPDLNPTSRTSRTENSYRAQHR